MNCYENVYNMIIPTNNSGLAFIKNRISYPGRSLCGLIDDMQISRAEIKNQLNLGNIKIVTPKYIWAHSKLTINVETINKKISDKLNCGKLLPYILVIPLTRKIISIEPWEQFIINLLDEVTEIWKVEQIITQIIREKKDFIPFSDPKYIIRYLERKGIVRYTYLSKVEYHTDMLSGECFDYKTQPIPHHQIKRPELNNFKISITEDCNQSCTYCYYTENKKVKRKKMSRELLFKSIDFILKMAVYKGLRKVSISWWGGDPAQEGQLLVDGVNYANKVFNASNILVRHSICSSFTTKDSEALIQFIKEKNIDTTISCDGNRELHNLHRKLRENVDLEQRVANSYDLMDRSRAQLISLGLTFSEKLQYMLSKPDYTDTFKDELQNRFKIKQRCTIYDESEIDNYENLCEYFDKYDEQYRISYATSKNNLESKHKFGQKIENAIRKAQNLLVDNYPNNLLNIKSIFLNMHTNPLDGINYCYSRCGFGGGVVIINTLGKIYSCHRFCDLEEYCIGSITDSPHIVENKCSELRTRWLNQYEPCKSCSNRAYCSGGGCAHEAYEYYDTTNINAGCISISMLIEKAKLFYIFKTLYPNFDKNILSLEDGSYARHCWYY